MANTLQIGKRQFSVLRGNLHIHTTLSDGNVDHRTLAQIAARAGLDFVVVTDHNRYRPGLDRWLDGTLLLVGQEVHDPAREHQSSHLLCFDISEDVSAHATDPQAVVDAVAAQGGFTFLAHPFERDVANFLPEPNISWRDWDVTGYAGIELWNYMSEFKSQLKNKAHGMLYAYFPALSAKGPYPETLAKWDELLAERPVAAFGGSDAHGTVYHAGPISRVVLPYDYLFHSLNTYLLSPAPLTGNLARDKALVYDALRAGRGFLGYERPAPVEGFLFWARSGGAEATMGEELALVATVELRVSVPAPARLRLLRDGQVVARGRGRKLALVSHRPGVYRVEAYRRHAGRRRGWLFSNPIYVR
ncbi:MAG: CehA/McbA family metallohydrolase [Anaerolineae bacterium]|jgi:hypothetical protein